MWVCKYCCHENLDDKRETCSLCETPKDYDPDEETKILQLSVQPERASPQKRKTP